MYSGFEFQQDQKGSASTETQHAKPHLQGQKSHVTSHDGKHVYNAKAPPFEEHPEGFQIPSQILELFETKSSAENKNAAQSRTSLGSRTTLDSRAPTFSTTNIDAGQGAEPTANRHRFHSFNALLNTSNEFGMGKNDLNTSGVSGRDRTMSINNLSRDSRNTTSMADLNNSNRRNQGSRANQKTTKNYQVTLNEDISLIERIELMLNQITMNHNKTCPFCSKTIDIKKSNFQNISAFLSNTSKRYYLTHFDCYLKSNNNPACPKIVPLSNAVGARVNSQISSLSTLDTSNFLRSDRRAYFVSIEGYHPVSTHMFFKIDKIAHGLEHASHRNQLLYLNFANKTTSIFEPSSYMIPFGEFKLVITVHMSHASEDPYTYEYLVDFSSVKVSAEQKTRFAEVVCGQEGNSMSIGAQVTFDPEAQNGNPNKSLDSSFQSTGSSNAKPDFGKNVFVLFKTFLINLPLKRIEHRPKEATPHIVPIVEETNFSQQHKDVSQPQSQMQNQNLQQQKKAHSRLQLNPHAPLFSNGNNPQAQGHEQTEQPSSSSTQQPSAQAPVQGQPQNQQLTSNSTNSQQNTQPFESQPFEAVSNPSLKFNSNLIFNQNQQGGNFIQQLEKPVSHPGQQYQDFIIRQQQQQQQQQKAQPDIIPPPGLGFGQNQMNLTNFNNLQQTFQPQAGQSRGFDEQFATPQGQMNFGDRQFNGQQDQRFGQFEVQRPQSFEGQNRSLNQGNEMQGDQMNQHHEEFQTVDKPLPVINRTRPANLYTAVLSGRKKEDSLPNSPSLSNLQSKYFSAASTPRSDYGHGSNTPLSHSKNDFLGDDETPTNQQTLTEEMIENFKIEDQAGNLVEFAKSYQGSRILQKYFPKANQNDVDFFLNEIEEKIEELMLDPYANYMFQTLAQSCSGDQRYCILHKIAPSMTELACDRKGTHALQALVALINRDIEEQLLRETLQNHIVELAFDPQGTHFVQRLINSISMSNMGFIYEPLVARFVEVANHSFGLCVLKTLMTKIEKSPELKKRFIKLLQDNLENLIQNPYGNYALQHALETFQNDCAGIFERTFDRIVQYSNQKFSSNVIEKCLVIAAPEHKKKFIKEITKPERMTELMKNKYGNFVLLKAIKSAENDDRQFIMQNLLKNLNTVSMAKYKNSWSKFIEENPLRIPNLNASQGSKPSIFRTNSGGSFNDDREMGDDSWGSQSKENQKKRIQDFNKDDKSQFYPGGMKGFNNQGAGHTGGFDDDRTALRENFGERKDAGQFAGKKGARNPNQKFYEEKNQHFATGGANKWGFNSFY